MIPVTVEMAMTTPVETISASATMAGAARRLRDATIGSLVVVDGDDIVGMVTESNIVTAVANDRELPAATVTDCMVTPVVTVERDATVVGAGKRMRAHDVRRLPVLDDGELVGIVTTTDLVHYLPRLRATIRRERIQALTRADSHTRTSPQ
jgi:CBS domain-containing protein